MARVKNIKVSKKEKKIDEEVVKMANDESAWERVADVEPKAKPTSIRLSPKTIQRAKFFARVHHERGYQSWLKKIVEERINTEYEMFKNLKKEAL
jgi:hypothetical protein